MHIPIQWLMAITILILLVAIRGKKAFKYDKPVVWFVVLVLVGASYLVYFQGKNIQQSEKGPGSRHVYQLIYEGREYRLAFRKRLDDSVASNVLLSNISSTIASADEILDEKPSAEEGYSFMYEGRETPFAHRLFYYAFAIALLGLLIGKLANLAVFLRELKMKDFEKKNG